MAARSGRFIDRAVELLSGVDSSEITFKIADNLHRIVEFLEKEKAASSSLTAAWAQASASYDAEFTSHLDGREKFRIDQQLSHELPGDLKDHPTYLPIAVIVCTQEPSDFFDEFNKATKAMIITSGSWHAFSFKSIMMLLELAVERLPSRPDPQMTRNIFRGLDTNQPFEKDQVFSLGYFAAFTLRRYLALGKKKGEDNDDDITDDVTAEGGFRVVDMASNSDTSNVTKTVLRMTFNYKVHALGVHHLSARGDEEREVLVLPQQKFKVTAVKNRPKKGFKLVLVEPVKI